MKKVIIKYKYLPTDNSSYKYLCKEANELYNKILNLNNQLENIKKENIKLKNIIHKKKIDKNTKIRYNIA